MIEGEDEAYERLRQYEIDDEFFKRIESEQKQLEVPKSEVPKD